MTRISKREEHLATLRAALMDRGEDEPLSRLIASLQGMSDAEYEGQVALESERAAIIELVRYNNATARFAALIDQI